MLFVSLTVVQRIRRATAKSKEVGVFGGLDAGWIRERQNQQNMETTEMRPFQPPSPHVPPSPTYAT